MDKIEKYSIFLEELINKEDLEKEFHHTVFEKESIIFRPELLLQDQNKTILSQSAHVLKKCAGISRISIVVDCENLSQKKCINIWKKSSFKDITNGFKLFTSLPCSINEVQIIEPKEKFRLWNIILSVSKNRMSQKMISKISII